VWSKSSPTFRVAYTCHLLLAPEAVSRTRRNCRVHASSINAIIIHDLHLVYLYYQFWVTLSIVRSPNLPVNRNWLLVSAEKLIKLSSLDSSFIFSVLYKLFKLIFFRNEWNYEIWLHIKCCMSTSAKWYQCVIRRLNIVDAPFTLCVCTNKTENGISGSPARCKPVFARSLYRARVCALLFIAAIELIPQLDEDAKWNQL